MALDRRDFLELAACAAASLAAPRTLFGAGGEVVLTGAVEAGPVAANLAAEWGDAIVVNALGSLANPNARASQAPDPTGRSVAARTPLRLDERSLRDAHASGLSAVNVTLGYVAGPGDPYERTIADIALYDRMLREQATDLLKVWTSEDIRRAHTERKVGVVYGFQNGVMCGERSEQIERIAVFADLGVRVIQLTYNPANTLGDGSMAIENRGLTPLGREVVERLNASRIMVDLSHSGYSTCMDAVRLSTQPISINHTGCRALVDLTRNKTDEELRLVAQKGGFIGIYFMPFLNPKGHVTADDVVSHVEHAVNVCGEDHVGIGTDGSVTEIDDLEGYRHELAEEVAARKKAGIGAAGEGPDTLPFALDLRGPGQFYELAARLKKRGHSRARIEKILGLNFVRFAREVWGA